LGRSGWAGRGLLALAIAGALATAGAEAEVPGSGTVAALPVSLQPAAPASGDSEIRSRIESAAGLVVAGETLHGALLRQFYAAHGFQPVWPTHQAQAEALLSVVMRSGEHGLDPALFHGALLRNAAALPPTDRELLLSDAFLAFADALARGALPIEQRMDDEDLTPEPVAIPAALDSAIDSPNPAAAIEALAPQSPEYMALRKALHTYQGSTPDRAASDASRRQQSGADKTPGKTLDKPADKPGENRWQQIVVNLERLRWLPRSLPADRVWINLANARLELYQQGQPVFSTRVVIGEVDKQTPELQTTIDSLLFNPPWNVPRSIASTEILPRLERDPDYLSRHHMVVRRNGAIQQLPGAGTALGQLKFEMQDRFDVYLHDTPLKNLFSRDNRRQSHGCVRVQNPRDLAALLLRQPVDVINKAIALGTTNRRMLPTPVAVFLVYQTAFLDADGTIAFRSDVYDRDQEIWQHLHPAAQAPVAQGEAAGQRRG
jgi:L,D-transpeptidase YcbB